jgi:hypothetical protein
MAMTLVDVVHVIAVRHRDMPARRPVLVVMGAVRGVGGRFALVGVALVDLVQVPVVRVVHVVVVRHRHVPAPGPVLVIVIRVRVMLGRNCHVFPLGDQGPPPEGAPPLRDYPLSPNRPFL